MTGNRLGTGESPKVPLASRASPPAPMLRNPPARSDVPAAAELQSLGEKLERVEGLKSPREQRRALSEPLGDQGSGHR
jgi:hypothetical protein